MQPAVVLAADPPPSPPIPAVAGQADPFTLGLEELGQTKADAAPMAGASPRPWLSLIEQREVQVVDSRCAYGYVPFQTAWFGERTSALTFGPSGAPTSFGSSVVSALKDVADTVGSLPQQVLSGLEIANKIVDQGEVAVSQTAERRLADLKRRQSILEQEVQTSDLEATSDLRSRLAIVKAEADLLTGRRDLESVTRDLALQRESTPIWQRAQLDEMANAILREQVERMELGGKVRDLTADLLAAPLEFAKRMTSLDEEIARLRLTIEKLQQGELAPKIKAAAEDPATAGDSAGG